MSRTPAAPDRELLLRHRRALAWAGLLILAGVLASAAVGRHPAELAPLTTIPAIGEIDQAAYDAAVGIRVTPLTWVALSLSVLGGGLVTIPLRVVALGYLAIRRRWLHLTAFAVTWIVAETLIHSLKAWFHRGRPPEPLVETLGFSFPSGHAMGVSATTVAVVLAFVAAGARRRRWEWLAVGYSLVMSISRVYLGAHWLSDVVVGTLLGSGIAIAVAAIVTEVRDLWFTAGDRPVHEEQTDS
jgi:undecaprenyl-diphosphatase